jgi:beta-glucosidase
LGKDVELIYEKGCNLTDRSTAGFAAAVEAARKADVTIVVLGDTSMILSGVGWEDKTLPASGTVGEGYDVTDPVPPGVQQDLVREVVKAGNPVVVIFLNGRPYSVPWMKEQVPAIVEAFYPGQQQGYAVADVLLGRVNPSGRLADQIRQRWPRRGVYDGEGQSTKKILSISPRTARSRPRGSGLSGPFSLTGRQLRLRILA